MEQTTLTPGQRAARKAVETRRARNELVTKLEAGASTCRLCGQATHVNGGGIPTYHGRCAEAAGIDHGPQAVWGLIA